MAAIAGRKADIYIVSGSGAGTAFTGEACSAVSGSGSTVYQISNATKRHWSTATAPSVLVDGVAPVVPYQIGYAGGVIVFSAPVTGTVTVSGAYLSTSKLGEGTGWQLDLAQDTLEDTAFGDTWKTYVPILKGATVSIERWWADEYFHTQAANALLVVLYLDQTAGSRYECLCRLTGNNVKAAVGALVGEGISLIVDGPVSFNAT